MGAFWDLVQAELDRERFPPSDRRLALLLGVAPSTPKNWRDGLKQVPTEKSIQAVAEFTGHSYETVLMIAQQEEAAAREAKRAARAAPAEGIEGRRRRSTISEAEQNQDPGGDEPL